MAVPPTSPTPPRAEDSTINPRRRRRAVLLAALTIVAVLIGVGIWQFIEYRSTQRDLNVMAELLGQFRLARDDLRALMNDEGLHIREALIRVNHQNYVGSDALDYIAGGWVTVDPNDWAHAPDPDSFGSILMFVSYADTNPDQPVFFTLTTNDVLMTTNSMPLGRFSALNLPLPSDD